MKTTTLLSAILLNVLIGFAAENQADWTPREQMLLNRIEQLERRLASLEARLAGNSAAVSIVPAPQQAAVPLREAAPLRATTLDLLGDATISVTLDGYYSYNFNRPFARVNLLRAYDVSSNSFSLNQAAVIFERAPNLRAGRRLGVRLDLQYGQATETLQGNSANEPRPQVYRPVFQAYGSYLLPLGSGVTVDFGKWASALGIENNYSKDQWNYSRSYYYNFLPFYHLGFRAAYNLTGRVGVMYWLVNGAQQSEDFNGFKSQALLFTIKPAKRVSWNVNYYSGREGRDALNNTDLHLPNGRLHILDTYATWNATDRLALAVEADYVIHRGQSFSAPSHVVGAAAYARYKLTPALTLAGRFEYLHDRGGVFSGAAQALKETTFTADYSVADGFLVRAEWRRDFSNRPFFSTELPGVRKHEQNTATLGLIWWFGGKKGVW